jgi:hypothetical protein
MRKGRPAVAFLLVFIFLVWLLPESTISSAQEDVWEEFRPLVGKWSGEGSGFGSVSEIVHEWDFVLQGKFLKLSTRSVSQKKDGSKEIHEDTGFLSRDTDRGAFVFRHFLSEGFVNTYVVRTESDDRLRIVFEHREAESAGGMRARMRLTFKAEDEYGLVLELAAPGKEFTACQHMTMKKIQ